MYQYLYYNTMTIGCKTQQDIVGFARDHHELFTTNSEPWPVLGPWLVIKQCFWWDKGHIEQKTTGFVEQWHGPKQLKRSTKRQTFGGYTCWSTNWTRWPDDPQLFQGKVYRGRSQKDTKSMFDISAWGQPVAPQKKKRIQAIQTVVLSIPTATSANLDPGGPATWIILLKCKLL